MPERARLGWVIFFVPDVEEALAFYEHKLYGQTVGFVRDPFGNPAEIASPLD